MKKTCISLLFILCLTLTALITACSDSAVSESGQTNSAKTTEAEKTIYELTDGYSFDGEDFNVCYILYTAINITTQFDFGMDDTKTLVNDAIYKRNRKLEEIYNLKFVQESRDFNGTHELLETSVLANDNTYELIMEINRNAYSDAQNGYILSTESLPYMDIDKEYYMHDINDQLSILGKYFIVYGADSLNVFEDSICFLFNKVLAENYNVGDLYGMVRSGTWTHDAALQMMSSASKDLDGNGKMNKKDQWGCVSNTVNLIPGFYISAGLKTIDKDENDYPYYACYGNEKFFDVLNNVLSYFNAHECCYNVEDYSTTFTDMFSNEQALFIAPIICELYSLRDMEDDFGLLPFPKYNEEQERYYSSVVDAWLFVAPITNSNPEGTSIIIEALAYETEYNVIPAYYEQTLKFKCLRDNDSVEMLDLVRKTLSFDLGTVTWSKSVRSIFTSAAVRKSPDTITSEIEENLPIVNELINNSISLYQSKK